MCEHDKEEEKIRREKTLKVLETLSERERQVILYRFGLDGGESHTADETIEHFGISLEKLRQIESNVRRRSDYVDGHRRCRSRKLLDFLE